MKLLLDDELWELIQPLIPKHRRRRRYPGRKRVHDRKALTGILYVLRTGIPWSFLPLEMGCGSGMTCWRRLRDWQRRGIWKKLHEAMLTKLREADRIDWSRAVLDSGSVRAVGGGKKRVRIRRIDGSWVPSTTLLRTVREFLWRSN